MKRALATLLASCGLLRAEGGGVTIITHGFNSNVSGWVTGMANEIPDYHLFPGTNFTTYTITLTTDGSGNYYYQWSRSNASPATADSGEIIVKLDWSQMAGAPSDAFNPLNNDTSTYAVAMIASYVLLHTNAISDLNGHALAELPLHLIGHSRGGSLMNELSRQLGTNGVWVDHLTTLDPHPLNNDGNSNPGFFPTDATASNTWATVLFRDNYWQDLGVFLDPDGEPATGAYNRQLDNLSGGYNNASSVSPDHSNVHLWYHGTIELSTPASDTEATITGAERTNWWVPSEDQGQYDGAIAGFYYSRIGGGNRMSSQMPLGQGFPAIVDGYNQFWDLGAGTLHPNRTGLPVNSGAWPNIIKFDVTGPSVVVQSNLLSARLYYQYGGVSNLTAQIYFDRDSNPFDSNSVPVVSLQPPATGTGFVSYYSSLGVPTTNIAPGSYLLFASISDGVRTRSLYAPEPVTIVATPPQPVLDISQSGSGSFVIGINGLSGQSIVLQVSSDLRAWAPIATNRLTGSHGTFTNSPPNGQLFYRAVLGP